MSRNRELADIIAGGFTVDDLPTLTETQIPNLSASKITSGTFADARISASNVSQHATSFDDNKIVNDISTLALRQASNENKSAYNTNSMYIDVFQDDTGIGTETNADRATAEFMSTKTFGSASVIDFDDIDGNGLDVKYKVSSGNLTNQSWGSTSFVNISDNGFTNSVDSVYWLANFTGTGGHMGSMNLVPFDTTDRTNIFVIFDFGATYQFGGVWYIGKQNGYGDMRKMRFQSSLDDSTYSDIDLSGTSSTTKTLSDGAVFSGTKTGGDISSLSSDGSFILSQHNGQYFTSINTMANFPVTEMRYLKIMTMNQYSGTANGNAGLNFNITKKPVVFNATGNFESNAITAPSSVSSMGAIITYQDNAGTNALNTDIVLKLSADNGSNYSTATLTAMPDFSSGIKMAKVNDLSVTAGTQLKYKIEFANQSSGSKEARIRGVSLQY